MLVSAVAFPVSFRERAAAFQVIGGSVGVLRRRHQTVADFLAQWLADVRPSLRPRTWERYEQYARIHVVPFLGRVRLSALGPEHIQRLYTERLAAGSSPTTVLHLHRFLHRALDRAVRWGLVARNVTDLVDPPRMARVPIDTLSIHEVRRLLDAAAGDRLEALYALAVTTGLREGELLALRWSDVDLATATLQVRGSLQAVKGRGLVIVEPKTPRSRRQVLLPQVAVAALIGHRRLQDGERRARGTRWHDLDLVFPNTVGRPLSAQNLLRRSFHPLLERAGLPQIRFHDVRHTSATLLLARNVHPRIVQDRLGHTSVGVTPRHLQPRDADHATARRRHLRRSPREAVNAHEGPWRRAVVTMPAGGSVLRRPVGGRCGER